MPGAAAASYFQRMSRGPDIALVEITRIHEAVQSLRRARAARPVHGTGSPLLRPDLHGRLWSARLEGPRRLPSTIEELDFALQAAFGAYCATTPPGEILASRPYVCGRRRCGMRLSAGKCASSVLGDHYFRLMR